MARKMVLIDPEFLRQQQSRGVVPEARPDEVRRLDGEIETILTNRDTDENLSDKLTKYNQVLNKYLDLVHDLRGQTKKSPPPLPLPAPTAPTSSDLTDDAAASPPPPVDTIDYITPKYQNKARRLLNFTRTIPGLSWTKKGELVLRDKVYTDSHIVDLLSWAVRPAVRGRRTTTTRAASAANDEFLRVLQEANTPQDLVSADVSRRWQRGAHPPPFQPPPPALPPIATPSPSRIPVSKRRRHSTTFSSPAKGFTWIRN